MKTGIKGIRETIGMVHVEMLIPWSLKMGNLVRGKVDNYIILQISIFLFCYNVYCISTTEGSPFIADQLDFVRSNVV